MSIGKTVIHLVANLRLKKDHSKRVVKEILWMADQLNLDDNARDMAAVMALFHDIGRFEQYARYHTFVDHQSENHAELGVKILQQHGVLKRLVPDRADLISRVISYHNRAVLPDDETRECLCYARMLRDADKLDIWWTLPPSDRLTRIEQAVAAWFDKKLPAMADN